MKRIGLNWSPIKKTPRTYASYRVHTIREFLIDLDKYLQLMGNDDCEFVLVFTDESYVNTNHASTNSYLPSDNDVQHKIQRKSGKGRRLIILRAITTGEPLVETVLEIPVSDLK